MSQMGIGMARHRQLIALKHMCRQREYLVHIPGIMERDTHGGSEEGGGGGGGGGWSEE